METCVASGEYAVAEGSHTNASGDYSIAQGNLTKAYGNYSHAEGNNTNASGSHSHSEGFTTNASGNCAHSEGQLTKAYGHYSHAEGDNTTASGIRAHSEGTGTTASGSYSHAEGYTTIAQNNSEYASGQYNISIKGWNYFGDKRNTLFTIGNGTSVTDENEVTQVFKHNVFQVMQDGTMYIVDTDAEGTFYEKPMINLQDVIKQLQGEIAELKSQLQSK